MILNTITRTVSPLRVQISLDLLTEDLEAAFGGEDPDEDLFFACFGPGWEELAASEQLSVLSRIAAIAEAVAEQATELGLSSSPPEPKEH